ncbi:hypothetical protein CEUSTIGMA_g11756.t1 [Chlamydomonas eustigma]|uniref:glycine--tRNA ligase n=1 Tax=Chlamydomonas eustigma TaxID=1157962 RepID=A0A250XMM0_9CHLO|nr:hypothetical protein CEUSTIGMA_g11756.t1 [Chlamydomonas eustigma]|eukprot:GAX84334.1 hypothetical protein CEUSTIGMA_g11756.t1 [Chlamydomonas eustigma]
MKCTSSSSELLLSSVRGPIPFKANKAHPKKQASASRKASESTTSYGSFHLNTCRDSNAWSFNRRVITTASAVTTPDTIEVQHSQSHAANGTAASARIAPTFQDAITKLQAYWASTGCAIWLPHNTEVGAGTMNPATFLRVLGPEPWNVCYAEPSIRPDDSRYGDNPNRLQRHTQFQVILKPDPGNALELYLGSLEALGIDTRSHDVRFVEDNWESPVLGAWGLGWEVWLDGMEVTQFTYFQQAGGKTLEAPAVEITYGMERILMALQGVTNFRDIRYNESLTYGELFLQNEVEMSSYNLDEADIEEQRARFELYDKEARRMLAKRLPIPAYDHVLKLSHTFNILDARGAVGVTERANCFAVMRQLAREVTGLWIARREELGHPLGLVQPTLQLAAPKPDLSLLPSTASTFVLEVGCEELPPHEVDSALEQLRFKVPALFQRLRLNHGEIRVQGTPRRLAVIVESLAPRQKAEEARVRGPPAASAYSKEGVATKALEGFCKKSGVSVSEVTREADAKGVEYCYVTVKDGGRAAAEVLSEELPLLLSSLAFKKSMRWVSGGSSFSRPVRWLLAMHDHAVVPFSCLGLLSGSVTRVLRNSAQPLLTVESADGYSALLLDQGILLDQQQRKEYIWSQVQACAAAAGGMVPVSTRTDLLEEVCNLVEAPSIMEGSFNESFLELPEEVLVMVMRKHQRYFPVFSEATGKLLPIFLTVANGPIHVATVAAGNEAVLRARFEDASFFYKEDLKQRLEQFRPKLQGTLFQRDLGSMLDKSDRCEALVGPLAQAVGFGVQAAEMARAAAHLAKADLATSTVMEMTALAGTMGRHYAYKQGESAPVAEAVFEAVLPRYAGDTLPSSKPGILVAVADRLDSLVGLFAAGCGPTATADPYGLRRSAYGMLQTLVSNGVSLSLRAVVSLTASLQPVKVSTEVQSEVLSYLSGRMEQLLIEAGTSAEAVRAVLTERGDNPMLALRTAEELTDALKAEEGGKLRAVMQTLGRPTRIVRGKTIDPSWKVSEALFDCDEERILYAALLSARRDLEASGPSSFPSINMLLQACDHLTAPIDAFFEKVFVMCEDETVRKNRLALLNEVASLTKGIVDLSQLPGF